MQYGGNYWNIKEILPYQRNFNFINSIRSQGKSYTSAGFVLDRFLDKDEQFIFIVRTVDEKKNGALKQWFEKVTLEQFPNLPLTFNSDTLFYTPEKDKNTWSVVGHCRALSEAVKVKKQSFPRVRWMLFDEYMLEPKHYDLYVKGWREPDLFLNMYHTIDREKDYVTCFLFGNNTAFYNPYHLHPAFQIPPCEPGEIWYSENVLFQRYEPSAGMLEKQKKNKFLKMVEGTEYGNYAKDGKYVGDNENFIQSRSNKANFIFAFRFDSDTFGVWFDYNINCTFVSSKYNAGNSMCLSLDNISNERDLRVTKKHSLIKWLVKKYVSGNVYYENMEIKLKAEKIIINKML